MPDPKEELGDPEMDPRNQEDVGAMATSLIDTDHNMPGDQPEDDTPPSKTLARHARPRPTRRLSAQAPPSSPALR